jgi:ketosteroid isomerase-like protein
MAEPNAKTVREWWDDWMTADPYELGDMSVCDSQVVYEDAVLPDHVGETYRGHDGMRKAWKEATEPWDDFECELEWAQDAGDKVVSCHRIRGRGKESNIEMEARYAYVWTFSGEKVVHLQAFLGAADALQAAGLPSTGLHGDLERARRAYTAINRAYRSGDANELRPLAREMWDRDIVLTSSGDFVEAGEWKGVDGVLRFTANQMEAFQQMWIEPDEFLEADGTLIVPYRFGGRARHTGIEFEMSFVHVISMRDGKTTRIDAYTNKAEALKAAETTTG